MIWIPRGALDIPFKIEVRLAHPVMVRLPPLKQGVDLRSTAMGKTKLPDRSRALGSILTV
jgi:hypothetical protein